LPKSRHPIKPNLFTLSDEAREGLAVILRRHQDPFRRRPEVISDIINELERQARDFVETRPASVANSDEAIREAVFELRRAGTRVQNALRALPPKASTLISERLLLDRAVAPSFLADIKKAMRLLDFAAQRVQAELAPSPKGGHPVDHRGQLFAADLMLTLSDVGIRLASSDSGPATEILEIIFEAVCHPIGDMRTLVDGARVKMGDLPQKKI
jgi:hypothetical protein